MIQNSNIDSINNDISTDEDDTLELDLHILQQEDDFDLNTEASMIKEEDIDLDKTFEEELQDDFMDEAPSTIKTDDEDIYLDDDKVTTEDEIISITDVGDLSSLNLDEIPTPETTDFEEEDETIGLSGDELDNILNSTYIIENENKIESTPIDLDEDIRIDIDDTDNIDSIVSDNFLEDEIPESSSIDNSLEAGKEEEEETERIDLDSFDADLSESDEIIPSDDNLKQLDITAAEEDEIYNSLRNEMQTKDLEETNEKAEALKSDVKNVLSYLDQLLDALPEEKIKEFAESETFDVYRKLFEELNIK